MRPVLRHSLVEGYRVVVVREEERTRAALLVWPAVLGDNAQATVPGLGRRPKLDTKRGAPVCFPQIREQPFIDLLQYSLAHLSQQLLGKRALARTYVTVDVPFNCIHTITTATVFRTETCPLPFHVFCG